MELRLHERLATKFTFLTVLLVSVTVLYFAVSIYWRDSAQLEKRFGLALERIVAVASLSIDGDLHRQVRDAKDAKGPAFQKIRAHLRRVQKASGLHYEHLYTFRIEKGRKLRFAVMLHPKPFVGDKYEVVETNAKAFARAVAGKMATHTRMYKDKHGAWISAYAPILDSKGKVAGLLEADVRLDRFRKASQREFRRLVMLSLSAVVLAIFLSVFFGMGIARALEKIRVGADAIQRQDYQHRIELSRKDELGLVAAHFNVMAESLAERFHMLKFLPQHTLDSIVRHTREGNRLEVEQAHGTIMFTDIRGYTSLSAELPAEKIVEMLNRYLRSQAEILKAHGGNIDKFIGDAVLAVFMGEDHERHALQAAMEIQQATEALNDAGSFEVPIHIGIGISTGDMVFGEIGSDERRERTLIGSVVNLAARLCSFAGAGEIALSGELHAKVGTLCPETHSKQVELKGFQELQAIHLLGKKNA